MSRRRGSLAGSPLLIGAVTALIIVVAVYISYNANHGLPFTPTYNIKAELPNAANLLKGNDVRIGGARVGVVEKIVPRQDPKTGRVVAIAYLKLEKGVQPLPADSTSAIVQSVSSIGLKYLSLERGTSSKAIPQGGTIPLAHVHEPVDIGEFFNMFDRKTRQANQRNLDEFSAGFAGRGTGLNEAFATLRPLVRHLTPVLHNLASPSTGFGQLWRALDRAAKEAAPVTISQGQFYANIDSFFAEWARVYRSLEATIVGGPSSLRTATYSFHYEAPFVIKSAEFMRLLRPSAKALVTAAPPLGHAFKVGAVNLAAAQALNTEVASSSKTLQEFATDPIVEAALEDLTHTATVGVKLVAGLANEQANCNYLALTFRNAASLFSQSIGVGTIARASVVLTPGGPNNEGYPASAPANGISEEHVTGSTQPIDSNHAHNNPYPNIAKCEAGNEQYTVGTTSIGNAREVEKHGEETTRSTDLYGRPYPESVLKALGVGSKTKKGRGK